MTGTVYAMLNRQQGLVRELDTVANNLANSNTTGFKADRVVFGEMMMVRGSGTASLSMGGVVGHSFDLAPGAVRSTGSAFDFALQGEGYFLVLTPQGERLTRAGHFQLSPEGTLIDAAGNAVLGTAGGTITLPPEAHNVVLGGDGTLSVDGEALAQIAAALPDGRMQRETGVMFAAPDGFVLTDAAQFVQGALERANVSPVLEMSRLIDVQRAYEAGQRVVELEDERIGQLLDATRM
jgi:flagellar basal-body rod protein FlgF